MLDYLTPGVDLHTGDKEKFASFMQAGKYPRDFPRIIDTKEHLEYQFQVNFAFSVMSINYLYDGNIKDTVGDRQGVFFTNTDPPGHRALMSYLSGGDPDKQKEKWGVLLHLEKRLPNFFLEKVINKLDLSNLLDDLYAYTRVLPNERQKASLNNSLDLCKILLQTKRAANHLFVKSPELDELYHTLLGVEPKHLDEKKLTEEIKELLDKEGFYKKQVPLYQMLAKWENSQELLDADAMKLLWPKKHITFKEDIITNVLPHLLPKYRVGFRESLLGEVDFNIIDQSAHPKFKADAITLPMHEINTYASMVEKYFTVINMRSTLQKTPYAFEHLAYHELMHALSMGFINWQITQGIQGYEKTFLSPFLGFAPIEEARAILAKPLIYGKDCFENATEELTFKKRLLTYYGRHNLIFGLMSESVKIKDIPKLFVEQYAFTPDEAKNKAALYNDPYLGKLKAIYLAGYARGVDALQESMQSIGREKVIQILSSGHLNLPIFNSLSKQATKSKLS